MRKLLTVLCALLCALMPLTDIYHSGMVIAEGEPPAEATPVPEATKAPTPEPTKEPTAAPTPEPTKAPTAEPTKETTPEPTKAPTAEPTKEPTAAPTAEPTKAPTAAPTPEPTKAPTAAPTPEPTKAPTAAPTAEPTLAPTAAPTAEPTPAPTAAPTPEATREPDIESPIALSVSGLPRYSEKNKSVEFTLNIAGGKAPYTVKVNGKEKTARAAGDIKLKVKPKEAGAFKIKVTVTDADGQKQTITQTLPVADRRKESPYVWEKELSGIELTGNWAEDVLAIALSQLGYEESKTNFIIDKDGVRHGYTRYGDREGYDYEGWCAFFVDFVLDYAGIEYKYFPRATSPNRFKSALLWRGFYEDDEKHYEPKPGDLIFFRSEGASGGPNRPDHMGIVTRVTENKVYSIEGNSFAAVRENAHDLRGKEIVGYGNLSEAEKKAKGTINPDAPEKPNDPRGPRNLKSKAAN